VFEPSKAQTWLDVLEILPDAIFVIGEVSAGWQISFANAQACRMFGYERDQLIGQSIDILLPDSTKLAHRVAYDRVSVPRTTGAGLQFAGRRQDGSEFPLDVLIKPSEGAEASATIAIVRDLSLVVATHEKQLQTLIDNLPVALGYIDKHERLQFANRAMRKFYIDDPVGMPVRTAVGETLYQATNGARQRALAGARATTTTPITVKGETRMRDLTYIPDFDADGRVQGVYSLGDDVTEREKLSAELHRSEERARELFISAPDGIFITDRAGQHLEINAAACRLLDTTAAAFVKRGLFDRIAPEDVRAHQRAFDQVLAGKNSVLECKLQCDNGHYVPVEISARLLQGGRVLHFTRDISDHQTLELELTKARDVAVRANDIKSKFLAAASHDLRQPLQTIWGVQAIFARAFANSGHDEHLGLLEVAVRTMDQILCSLIDINRLEKGVIDPVIRDFSLEEVLPTLRAEFVFSATTKGITLDIENSSELAHSDPALLLVILRNLIGNALKYTSKGAVQLRTRVVGQWLMIDVRDSGAGIQPEHLQRLFDAFFQIDNPSRDIRKGVGLGLSIVQTICRMLGHEVTIVSEPGLGSIFTLQVPRGTALSAVAPEDTPGTPAPTRGAGGKILHIEDDLGIAHTLAHLLHLEGYEVTSAATHKDALNQVSLQGLRPDLILCDFHLHGYTAVEILTDLNAVLEVKTPAIILTGDIADRHLAQARSLADRILYKPTDVNLLLKTISELLAPSA
jgi:PAS domain S-box-containing protein